MSSSGSGPTSASVPASRSCLAQIGAWLRSQVSDWPGWWSEQSRLARWTPVLFFLLYWGVLYRIGGLRSDHLTIGWIILGLSYSGRIPRAIRDFLMPVIMTLIFYDSMRFWADYVRGEVHVEWPYYFDKTWFGITTAEGVLTPNEWFGRHLHWALDLVTGFAYLVFVAVFVLNCALFRYVYARKGTSKLSAEALRKLSPAAMWSFFWVNMLGYSTYYWFPAAPPWYVEKYGLGPANMEAQASSARCVRFDQLLGTNFFGEFYGKSADVFGAIPSLHVAYPLIAAYFAFRFGVLRVSTTLFYLLMCFAAVYLNHHYIIDVIWGSAYAIFIAVIVDRYYRRKVVPTFLSSPAS